MGFTARARKRSQIFLQTQRGFKAFAPCFWEVRLQLGDLSCTQSSAGNAFGPWEIKTICDALNHSNGPKDVTDISLGGAFLNMPHELDFVSD